MLYTDLRLCLRADLYGSVRSCEEPMVRVWAEKDVRGNLRLQSAVVITQRSVRIAVENSPAQLGRFRFALYG